MTSLAMPRRHRPPTSTRALSRLSRNPLRTLIAGGLLGALVAACGGAATSTASPAAVAPSSSPVAAPSESAAGSASPAPSQDASQEPDTGAGTATGDVPDNAVFLTYSDPALGFSIQYVEGWQVRKAADGVLIARQGQQRDRQGLSAGSATWPSFVSGTDLPALTATTGFKLNKQDSVKIRRTVARSSRVPDPIAA